MAKQEGPRGFETVESPSAGEGFSFAGFVLSLATSALVHLGITPEGEHEKDVEPNLEAARQVIDILEMLQAKTRGNLDESERAMLESSLHDLHMRFVQAKSKS